MNQLKITLKEQVASLLARGEPMTAAQLCAATGKSQPSMSLALAALGDRIARFGAARSSRYALVKDILGLPATQPIVWTDAAGQQSTIGSITHLQSGGCHQRVLERSTFTPPNTLPWYLQTLKPQGFLGRQLMRSRPDLPQDPEQLSAMQTLYLVAAGWTDPPGAITVGAPSRQGPMLIGHGDLKKRLAHFEDLANLDASSLPAKSCAGGEQPKFPVLWADEPTSNHLVKFTPPHGTPFGVRWKALLQLEHLAQNLLQDCAIESAKTQCFHGDKRFFLSSQRFDRVGTEGKRHVVAISALHDEFTPGSQQNWVHTAEGLHAKKLITPQELRTIATIHAFGQYIGNTDMHFGNLSFFADDVIAPKISLAPVYDMLPMMWRPDPHHGLSDSPIRPQRMPSGFEKEQAKARQWAIEFWQRAAQLDIGADLQAAAQTSAQRLKTNFADL